MAVTGTPTNGNDVLSSDAAADSIDGLGGNDVITGGDGNDTLNGSGGNDTLLGEGGDDSIIGGSGADLMTGGIGADTFFVDNSADQVVEARTDAGVDTVIASASWVAGGNNSVERIFAVEGAGNINLTGSNASGATRAFGYGISNGNPADQTITGNSGDNILDGGADLEYDVLIGGNGNDTYIINSNVAGAGNDQVFEGINGGIDTVFAAGSFVLTAGAEVEVVSAINQSSTLAIGLGGNEFRQIIVGNQGDNTFQDDSVGQNVSTAGADTLVGLNGNDYYNVFSYGTEVREAVGGGYDVVVTGHQGATIFAAGAGQEIEVIAAFGPDDFGVGNFGPANLTGNEFGQGLYVGRTGASADTLNGGGGSDTMFGSLGNDIYFTDTLGDVVVEFTGEGTDIVFASGSFALRQSTNTTVARSPQEGGVYGNAASAQVNEVEVLAAAGYTLTFGGAVQQGDSTLNLNTLNSTVTSNFFVGNTNSQIILGDAGANILNGLRNGGNESTATTVGTGADTLVGGGGDDTYRVYQQDDVVVEDLNGGVFDFIYSSANFSLAQNDINAAAVNNAATGLNMANYLAGGQVGQIEVLSSAQQNANLNLNGIRLDGNTYGNIVIGDFGINVLDGGGVSAGGGPDQLTGLRGNDIYLVRAQQTTVNENVGEGIDTVEVGFAGFFKLIDASEVEFITASGTTTNLAGVQSNTAGVTSIEGNAFAQVITGNNNSGFINGGGGADTLVGLGGNDSYLVTQANVAIAEATGGGSDTVFTTVSYDLAETSQYFANATDFTATNSQVEVEALAVQNAMSTDALTLRGNSISQTIVGNYGDNTLDGRGGTDTLIGLRGNDNYRVDSAGDVVTEVAGEGTDSVTTTVSYTLTGGSEIETFQTSNSAGTGGLILFGNEFGQTIAGNAGNNRIAGRGGNDTLIGNGGNDVFVFDTTLNATTNVDGITDFSPGDRVGLSNVAGGPFAAIAAGRADGDVIGSAQFSVNTANGTGAQIVYNQASGEIFYDVDGTGASAAILFARVTPGTVLAFNDFIAVTPTAP